MTNATIDTSVSNAASEVAAPAITFTVKSDDIVTGTIARIKRHPDKGLLVQIPGNPMAFMPNGCISGYSDADKMARRELLIAAAGSEITIMVLATSVDEKNGVKVGRVKVSEKHASVVAEKAENAQKAGLRRAAIKAAVEALVPGSIVEGTVKATATQPSKHQPGTMYVYGVFIELAPNVAGLLHVNYIDGGQQGLDKIIEDGKVTVQIMDGSGINEKGEIRIQLSQKAVVNAAEIAAFYDQFPVGHPVRATVKQLGESVDNLHGIVLEMPSGHRVFLADEDTFVKNASSLAKDKTTRVSATGEIVGGYFRVTRKGL